MQLLVRLMLTYGSGRKRNISYSNQVSWKRALQLVYYVRISLNIMGVNMIPEIYCGDLNVVFNYRMHYVTYTLET